MKWIAWSNVTLGDAVGRFARNTKEWVPADQRNAKAGAGTQRDTAPDAESNARAARKTAAEAPRLTSRVSYT